MAKQGISGHKWAILGPFLHRWVHFSDEFCVQSSPPTCVPMCTTNCSTCASHLGPPQPPMAKEGIYGHKWAILGPFLHRWALFSDAVCVQSSPPACVPMCTTICTTFASHLGPPRPPMAKSGIFGQKWAILGPFFHRWVHLSDAFCVQSSPPACNPMCTTICTTFASHLGPPQPPMAKSGIFGQKWAIFWSFWYQIG